MIDGIGGQGGFNPAQFNQMKEQSFKTADADGDGAVSKAEFGTVMSDRGMSTDQIDTMFSKIDTGGDGSISQNESDAAIENMKEKMETMMGFMKSMGSGGMGSSGQSMSLLDALENSDSDDSEEDDYAAELQSYVDELQKSGAGSAGNFFKTLA
ncbi:MAG: EF-hand domain-containing protein [Verrucomicrobiota bacterium]